MPADLPRSSECEQIAHLRPRGDMPASADRRAIQRSCRIREVENFGNAHSLKHSIAESPMKGIAGSGRIHTVNVEGRGIEVFLFVEGHSAVLAQRHGRDLNAILTLNLLESNERIRFSHPSARP